MLPPSGAFFVVFPFRFSDSETCQLDITSIIGHPVTNARG